MSQKSGEEIIKECPMCHELYVMELTETEYEKLFDNQELIQDLFPEFNPMEREFLMTGYCPQCQEKLFGTQYTSERILSAGDLIPVEPDWDLEPNPQLCLDDHDPIFEDIDCDWDQQMEELEPDPLHL